MGWNVFNMGFKLEQEGLPSSNEIRHGYLGIAIHSHLQGARLHFI